MIREPPLESNFSYKNALDQVNAFPLYQSSGPTGETTKNDLVKFRIGVINNNNPSKKNLYSF